MTRLIVFFFFLSISFLANSQTKNTSAKTNNADEIVITNRHSNSLTYTANDKVYQFKKDDVGVYHKIEENEGILYYKYSIYVSYIGGDYTDLPELSIIFYIPKTEKLTIGRYKIADILGFLSNEKCAYISVSQQLSSGDLNIYSTLQNGDGVVEITSINNSIVEGKIEIDIPYQYNKDDKLKIKNCSFKVKIESLNQ